jgi:beta-xylosidase
MVTMARSKSINGPYDVNPSNPVLTNSNTTSYCMFCAIYSRWQWLISG